MMIVDIILKSYKQKLSNPLINSNNQYRKKEGFIIQVISNNHIGFGEVSPLKYFSKETLSNIKIVFEIFLLNINKGVNMPINKIIDLISHYCNQCPSLIFGLQTAIYDIIAKENKISLAKYLNPNAADEVELEITLSIKNFNLKKSISGKILIE